MKIQPSRNVCFARDRYYLHLEIRSELLKSNNQAGAENKFRRGINQLILKHKGYVDSHHKTIPQADGTTKVLKHTLIRFNDNTSAAVPNPKWIYIEPEPFCYHASPGEQIPEHWNPNDFDVTEG